MTGIKDLMTAIYDDLRELFRGYTLRNKAGNLQEVRIFNQYMPQPAGVSFENMNTGIENYTGEDYESNFPCVLIKLGDITDKEERRLDMNRVNVRLLCGVYDDNPICNGWSDVLAMLECIRHHWLKERIIGRKFRIEMPLVMRLIDEYTYPVYFGEMESVMETGRPVRPEDYVYRGYMSNG